MRNYTSLYYQSGSGRCPVQIFVNNLNFRAQRKFFAKMEWLEEYGPKLPQPHAKKITSEIYELRFHCDDGIARVLYFFYVGNKIILLSGFKKKTQKIPRREIELAEKRRKEFLVTLAGCIVEQGGEK